MDREAIRNVVYRNPEMMKVLEKGTTEVIVRDTKAEIERMRTLGAPVTFVAIPLLFESGSDGSEYDGVWAVTASEEVRVKRVMARDGLTEEMVRRILKKQVSDEVRERRHRSLSITPGRWRNSGVGGFSFAKKSFNLIKRLAFNSKR